MSTEQITPVHTDRNTGDPEVWHIWTTDPTKPGDKALCGHVKVTLRTRADCAGQPYQVCVVCDDLWEGRR